MREIFQNTNSLRQRLGNPFRNSGRWGIPVVFCLVFGAVSLAASSAWQRIDPAKELLAGVEPQAGGIQLELPSVTQDGSAVPITVEVTGAMNPDRFVEALYLFGDGNPSPEILEVTFTPLAGKARISTRIRLNRTQQVVALARTNTGEWFTASREVRVTVSGCITQDSGNRGAADPNPRVRVPNRFRSGEAGEVRTLVQHPMETGLRRDAEENLIPERILHRFTASLAGEPVLSARLHRAVSANPYLLFHVAPPQSGELTLQWEEDTGEQVTATAAVRTN